MQLRPLEKTDCPHLPPLLEAVWGKPSDEAYWRWKYFDAPFPTKAAVVEDQGRIIGLNGCWLRPAWLRGRTVHPAMIVDTMLHPDYRRSEATRALLDFFLELARADDVFGFTNPLSHAYYTKHLDPAACHTLALPIRFSMINWGALFRGRPWLARPLGGLSRLANRLRPGGEPGAGLTVTAVEKIGPEFDRLWQEGRGDYYWVLDRSADILHWRFLEAPGRPFTIWTAREGERLVGYLAVNRTTVGERHKALLLDYFIPGGRTDVFAALIGRASRNLIAGGVDEMELCALHLPSEWAAVLRRHWFVTRKLTRTFVYNIHLEQPSSIALVEQVAMLHSPEMFITYGDSDVL